jgi:hypothetical protein
MPLACVQRLARDTHPSCARLILLGYYALMEAEKIS